MCSPVPCCSQLLIKLKWIRPLPWMQANVNSTLMSDTLTEAELLFCMYLCQVRKLSDHSVTSISDWWNYIIPPRKTVDLNKTVEVAALSLLTDCTLPLATCTLSAWQKSCIKETTLGNSDTNTCRSSIMLSSKRSLWNHVQLRFVLQNTCQQLIFWLDIKTVENRQEYWIFTFLLLEL